MEFFEKVVVITGGTGGIGSQVADLFYNAGAKVVIVDINEQKLKEVAVKYNKNILTIKVDLNEESEINSMFHKVLETFGSVDVFINNAGTEGKLCDFEDIQIDDLLSVYRINVFAPLLCMQHCIRHMKNRGGSIVNIASVAGVAGSPKLGVYSSSKHALIGLTKTAALENVTNNIRVNAICPSPVKTRMIDSIDSMRTPGDFSKSRKEYEAKIPMNRYADPIEIANLIYFLASDKASYITGAAYRIDGGMGARA